MGPHAEPAPGARADLRGRRHRGAHPPALLDQDRTPLPPLVAQRHRGRRRPRCRSRAWGWRDSSSRCACWCSCPAGRSAVDAASLRGLMTFSDSLRADPRVREVRSLVGLEAHGQPPRLLGALQRPPGRAREVRRDFLDAYLSTDRRLTLMDVILSDTTSLTTATDVVIRARTLARTAAPRHQGDDGHGRRLLRGRARFPGRPARAASRCWWCSSWPRPA